MANFVAGLELSNLHNSPIILHCAVLSAHYNALVYCHGRTTLDVSRLSRTGLQERAWHAHAHAHTCNVREILGL